MKHLLKSIALMAGGTILALSLSTNAMAKGATVIVIQGADKILVLKDIKPTKLNMALALLKTSDMKQGGRGMGRAAPSPNELH